MIITVLLVIALGAVALDSVRTFRRQRADGQRTVLDHYRAMPPIHWITAAVVLVIGLALGAGLNGLISLVSGPATVEVLDPGALTRWLVVLLGLVVIAPSAPTVAQFLVRAFIGTPLEPASSRGRVTVAVMVVGFLLVVVNAGVAVSAAVLVAGFHLVHRAHRQGVSEATMRRVPVMLNSDGSVSYEVEHSDDQRTAREMLAQRETVSVLSAALLLAMAFAVLGNVLVS